jgi:hypothetical protein
MMKLPFFFHISKGRQWNYQIYTTHTQVPVRKQNTNFNVKNTIFENLPPYVIFEVLMQVSIMRWFSGI